MPSVYTTIDIAASPERVWAVLTCLDGYGRWNPFLRSARGWLEPGAPLDVCIAVGTRSATVGVRVLRVDPAVELRWRGPRSSLLRRVLAGEHYFLLEKSAIGCHLVHGETFTGAAARLVIPPLLPQLRRAYSAMNDALKRTAETS